MSEKQFTFMDTFAGMGGLRLGVEEALKEKGYQPKCVGTAEIKTHALKTLEHVFQGEEFPYTDITKIDETEIPEINALIGGFPCQTFSTAGNQDGFEDTRGTLFYDLARIMKEKRPKWALFENVKGLYRHDKGRTFEVIVRTFEDLGYYVSYTMLDSKDYGLAGSRPRVFIVCHQDYQVDLAFMKTGFKPFKEIKENKEPIKSEYTDRLLKAFTTDELRGRVITGKRKTSTVIRPWDFDARGETTKKQKEILEAILEYQDSPQFNKSGKTVPVKVLESMVGTNLLQDLDELVKMEYIKEHNGGYRSLFGQLSGRYTKIIDENRALPTLTATDMDRLGLIEGEGLRGLTKKESLRALGYPEWFTFPDDLVDSNIHDLIGNTVSPPVIKMIVDRILETEEANKDA